WKIIPTDSNNVKIVTNGVDVPSVAPGQGVSPNGTLTSTTVALQFVEFALDLTALNLLPLDPCNPLSTVLFQTRSSPSFTSSLMDYALGTFAIVPPPKADAGPDQAVCADPSGSHTFTLTGTVENGTPSWSTLDGPAVVNSPLSTSTTVTFTGTGVAHILLTV